MFAFILVLTILRNAIAQDIPLCYSTDNVCLTKLGNFFVLKTSAGVPELNIPTFDPLHISQFEYKVPQQDVVIYLNNVTVAGLGELTVSNSVVNKEDKSMEFKSSVRNAHVVANIDVKANVDSQHLIPVGHFEAQASVTGATRYNFDVVTDKQGIRHFSIGPEKVKLDVKLQRVIVSSDFNHAVIPGPDSVQNAKDENDFHKAILEAIFEKAYSTVIENLRVVVATNPVSTYFKDL